MLITYRHLEVPMEKIYGVEYRGWNGFKLWPDTLLFLIRTKPKPSTRAAREGYQSHTVIHLRVEAVEIAIDAAARDKNLIEVHLLTPEHLNHTKGWNMERLIAVWNAEEKESRERTTLLEVEGGRCYPDQLINDPQYTWEKTSLRFAIPGTTGSRRNPSRQSKAI